MKRGKFVEEENLLFSFYRNNNISFVFILEPYVANFYCFKCLCTLIYHISKTVMDKR